MIQIEYFVYINITLPMSNQVAIYPAFEFVFRVISLAPRKTSFSEVNVAVRKSMQINLHDFLMKGGEK